MPDKMIFLKTHHQKEINLSTKNIVWSEMEKLSKEKDVLGFYVSGHPLLKYQDELNTFTTLSFGEVEGKRSGLYRVGGIVTSVKRKSTKRKNDGIYYA